ncbi:MAG: hypothetical protein AAF570_17610, partial [Bacteroidota bacterium]
ERAANCEATQDGQQVTLNLEENFSDAVVAIHLSERHDLNGVPMVPPASTPLGEGPNSGSGNFSPTTVCDPEPATCANMAPTITSFAAAPENGAIKLTWSISNFPASLCHWGRVRVTKYNLQGGIEEEWLRYADDPPFIYDGNGGPNVVYNYSMTAYVAFIDPFSPPLNNTWITCQGTNNPQYASAAFPQMGPAMNSFSGTTLNNSQIRYDWYPSGAAPIAEYRLRRWTPTGYQTLPGNPLGPNETDFLYNYPTTDRGELVEMQMQFRAAGPWQGNFIDKSYASFRNPGQPLKFYGIRIANLSDYEFGESPLYGAPEIRVFAVRTNSSGDSETITQTMLPTTRCVQISVNVIGGGWIGGTGGWSIPIWYQTTPLNFYWPSVHPNGYEIIHSWSDALYGQHIRIVTKETDSSEPVITSSTTTNTASQQVSSQYGHKEVNGDITTSNSVTYTTKFSSSQQVTIRYPADDIDIDMVDIFYFEDPTSIRNNQLYGDVQMPLFGGLCNLLQQHL